MPGQPKTMAIFLSLIHIFTCALLVALQVILARFLSINTTFVVVNFSFLAVALDVYKRQGLPCVVAINAFPTDTKAELDLVERKCNELGVNVALSEVWAKGGEGGKALAEEVIRLCEQPSHFQFVYDTQASIQEKLDTIVKKVYHGERVVLTANAKKQAQQLTDLGFGDLPICMAKTQYSFSDDQTLLGAPSGFEVTVRNLKVSAGAGFIVALTGDIMTMPGLPKVPSAEKIDVDENGKITGLF